MSTSWYKQRIPKRIRSWTSSPPPPPTSSSPPSSLSSSSSSTCTDYHRHRRHQQQPLQQQRRSIDVWETTCIVTNMNGNNDNDNNDANNVSTSTFFSFLINPANPSLSGVSKFPYFPVGGPEPTEHFQINKDTHPIMGYTSQWGGMDVGNGMMFASNTVDGLIHQYGGKSLQEECRRAIMLSSCSNDNGDSASTGDNSRHRRRIDEGTAIETNVVGKELIDISRYKKIIHTVPPFYHHHKKNQNQSDNNYDNNDNDNVDFLLAECYRNSLNVAIMSSITSPPLTSNTTLDMNNTSPITSTSTNIDTDTGANLRLACPLLGAGCKGFPIDRAIQIAAKTTIEWMMNMNDNNPNSKLYAADNNMNNNINMNINMNMNHHRSNNSNTTNAAADNCDNDSNDYVTPTNADTTMTSTRKNDISQSRWWWNWLFRGREEESKKNKNKYKQRQQQKYQQQPQSITLAFGIPDGEIRKKLIEAIDREMDIFDERDTIIE